MGWKHTGVRECWGEDTWGTLCKEKGAMVSMRPCGEGAALVGAAHRGGMCLQGCLHPFVCRRQFPDGGGSSPGQTGTLVAP